jgi:tRNA 2-selenouridine synthase
MAEQMISLDEFWVLRDQIPIIDARSEGEFELGHLPNAQNLPILNNEERIIVGTIYKEKGPEKATLKGFELVGPRFHIIQKEALKKFPSKKIIIYCWRGGMRSQILSWLLEMIGFEVYRLKGGYKTYRTYTYQLIRKDWKLIVLGGKTGTGKTRLLHELKIQGEQIIDIEGLANHKGSSFGSIGQPAQPSVEQFENLFAEQLRLLNSSLPIWVENESRKIGRLILADRFYEQMIQSPLIDIQKSEAERIQLIAEEYSTLPPEELIAAVNRLSKRLGGLRTSQAIAAIESENHQEWISNLLIYYDKTYEFDLDKHAETKRIILDLTGLEPKSAIPILLKTKSTFYGNNTNKTD